MQSAIIAWETQPAKGAEVGRALTLTVSRRAARVRLARRRIGVIN